MNSVGIGPFPEEMDLRHLDQLVPVPFIADFADYIVKLSRLLNNMTDNNFTIRNRENIEMYYSNICFYANKITNFVSTMRSSRGAINLCKVVVVKTLNEPVEKFLDHHSDHVWEEYGVYDSHDLWLFDCMRAVSVMLEDMTDDFINPTNLIQLRLTPFQ